MSEEYSGPDRRKASPKPDKFFVVNSAHTVIIVLTVLAGIILSYGSVRDRTDQNSLDIKELKDRPQITQSSIDSLNYRLTRIENKLDAQDVRQWQRDAEAAAAPRKR